MKPVMPLLKASLAVLGAGLAGQIGYILVVVAIGGVREPSADDILLLLQIGGVPGAGLGFHLLCQVLLRRWIDLGPAALAFVIIEAGLGPLADWVVSSPLTGDQGSLLAAGALAAIGLLCLTFFSRPLPPRPLATLPGPPRPSEARGDHRSDR